ncbi:MAG: DUF1801 domain-containing protein [Flammeovirgaceae bacterium]|nr:MAG: DUF1801 domain-containing protein [Flammeovirgaceae bacterium]
MNTSRVKHGNVERYIAAFPVPVQEILKKIRAAIRKAAPGATERISYGMPFYEYGGRGYAGRLIYFAAFKKHISLFITPRHNETIPSAMKKYHVSKATYQFALNEPVPFSLIEKTVKNLVSQRDNQRPESKPAVSTSKKQMQPFSQAIRKYNSQLTPSEAAVCNLLAQEITNGLPDAENKIWHAHPVWFLAGNPIVGYSKQKKGIRLMFWSGAGFEEDKLNVRGEKFKDASVFYNTSSEVNAKDLQRWLKKARLIQWDYKNLVKRKGRLERLL